MSKILTIFSGSFGHAKGLIDFIMANDIEHEFYFASHIEGSYKGIRFIQLQSPPAYQNLEFSLNMPLIQQLKLKLEDVLPNQRKAELKDLISELNPNVILLDNYNFTDALLLKGLDSVENLPVVFYQTRLSSALDRGESTYGGLLIDRFEFLKARKILNQQRKRRRIHRITMPYFSDEYKLKNLINKLSLSHVSLNYERYGMASLTNLPEMVLSNPTLSHFVASNQQYMGLGMEDKIVRGSSPVKNILVSVGSRNFTFEHTNDFMKMISALVPAFLRWIFLLPDSFQGRIKDENVQFYDWNDYGNMLQEAHLHITHGGINSIKDSLSYGIPMLICPMDWENDQIHNALLFEKLGTAKIWNLKEDNPESVSEKLSALSTGYFKEAISEFVRRDKTDNPPERLRERFNDILEDERCQVRNW